MVKVSGRPTPENTANPYRGEADYMAALSRGRAGAVDDPTLGEMRKNRRINARTASTGGFGSGGGGVSFATGRPQDPMFYWRQNNLPFDYSKPEELKKIRAYCNTPEAPVLMADGTFKPIGEIVAGEQVMGWEWRQGERGHWRKRLRPTAVLATQRRIAPEVVEATMESGRVIRCTPDHQWANFYYSPASRGNEYEPMLRGSRGGRGDGTRRNTMCRLVDPVEALTERKMIDAAGYLSGMIDADGTVAAGEIRIGQSLRVNGPICDQIEQSLNVLGLDYRVFDRPEQRIYILKGTLENRLRLREWMPLSVKVRKAWEDRQTMRWTGGRDQVVSTTDLGPGEVVSMQTETGNYIAWGYASKNCRIIYATHPVIASAIDVYSKYPLTGMEISCFAGETRVVTDRGTRSISDLSGGTHRVITSTGHWVDADFDSYGVQPLLRMTVRRNHREQVIYTTAAHRWFIENTSRDSSRGRPRRSEVTTRDLTPGARLATTHAINRVLNTHPSSIGVAHGITFGDGSLKGRRGNEGYITLVGQKNIDLLRYFPEPNVTKIKEGTYSEAALRVYDLPGYFKERPSLDESTSYLYGWLAGYFAADGTVSKKGECILYSASRENIDFAQTVCHRLGIRTAMPYEVVRTTDKIEGPHTMWYLPIDAGSLTAEFFVTAEHRLRWVDRAARGFTTKGECWTVVSVEETDRVEEVYCAKVPGTESFVLEGNLLTGNCKDEALVDFYSTLFFDQLDYEDFLVDVGREKWTVGEAWPLGSFNETLGVWEDDELLNPDDIDVIRSPFLKEPRFEMRLPKVLRDIIETRQPQWEFEALMRSYPELKNFVGDEARMPVSNVLLKQIKFKADTFSLRGLPILMRGFRAIMQEEMLNAAQDAIASRLYTPLVLAKLGASATDLGTNNPWIPTEDDLSDFEESLDAALAGDFRVLTHHFALQMESVFGREAMPNFDADFERLVERQLQVFGMSKTMLSGAGQGETFAADAINRDLISQLLTGHQRDLNRLFMDRARVVAEAQEHYDYEERGGKRYVVMEEIYEVDEETGEGRIVEQPKLLVPELKFKAMTMKDEENERALVEALRASGIPISMKTRMWNLPIDLDDEVQRVRDEQVQMAVEAEETRKATFLALDAAGLPIPEDLNRDFRAKAMGARPAETSDQHHD
jgi:hypothetical protein